LNRDIDTEEEDRNAHPKELALKDDEFEQQGELMDQKIPHRLECSKLRDNQGEACLEKYW
jgi:hypothetical protein